MSNKPVHILSIEEYAELKSVQTEPSTLIQKSNDLLLGKLVALKEKLQKAEEDLSVYVIGGASKITPTDKRAEGAPSTFGIPYQNRDNDIYLVATYNAVNNKLVQVTVDRTADLLGIKSKEVKHKLKALIAEGFVTRANNHYTITKEP